MSKLPLLSSHHRLDWLSAIDLSTVHILLLIFSIEEENMYLLPSTYGMCLNMLIGEKIKFNGVFVGIYVA